MKNVWLFFVSFLIASCWEDGNKEKCNAVFKANIADSSFFYLSTAYNYNGKCVQNFKLKGSEQEYGQSSLLKDTLILYKGKDDIYLYKKEADSLSKVLTLVSKAQKLNDTWQTFYDFELQDTINRIKIDAKIRGKTKSNIYLVLLVGIESGFLGMYIYDESDYFVEKYHKSLIRSIRGNAFVNNIDTAKTVISTVKKQGVYY